MGFGGLSKKTVVHTTRRVLTWYPRDQFQRSQHAERAQHAQVDVNVCLRKDRHGTTHTHTVDTSILGLAGCLVKQIKGKTTNFDRLDKGWLFGLAI